VAPELLGLSFVRTPAASPFVAVRVAPLAVLVLDLSFFIDGFA
jgi:hypothetical protein